MEIYRFHAVARMFIAAPGSFMLNFVSKQRGFQCELISPSIMRSVIAGSSEEIFSQPDESRVPSAISRFHAAENPQRVVALR